MLTGDLVRVRIDGSEIRPGLVDPTRSSLVEFAESLIDAFRQGVEERWTRSQVDEEVDALVGDSRDHKLLRGIAKVLADRSTFETQSPIEPVALRDEVFRCARARGPLALDRGPFGRPTAEDVLACVGALHGLTSYQVGASLYADLREQERLSACEVADAKWLLDRYNVALVQSLLLHATELRLTLTAPTVPRLRQLFRHIKFHQLIHRAHRVDQVIHVNLDGPLSLFQQSTRYGMQLASFFPAFLLQQGPWRLEATVLWTKARHRKQLTITPELGLVSHVEDTGSWASREQQWFLERFEATPNRWRLESCEPLDLGGRAVILPDFTFTDGERRGHLEIVGYWRKDWLERRLALLERYGPGNLVLAVSRKLFGDKEKLAGFPGAIVEFSEVVPVKAVLEALDRVASPVSSTPP